MHNRTATAAAAAARVGRGKRGKAAPTKQLDECHSRDIPCCRLVQEATLDIFPEVSKAQKRDEQHSTTESKTTDDAKRNDKPTKQQHQQTEEKLEASSVFGRLIRKHLLEQHRRKLAPQQPESQSKKKRKRKKKKAASSAAGEEDFQSETTSSENQVQSPGETEAAVASETASESQSLPAAAAAPKEKLDENALMVERWLDRIASDAGQQNETQLRNRDLESFLEFLAKPADKKSNKSPGAPTISIADVQSAYDSISCDACKQSVEGFLRSMHLIPSFEAAYAGMSDDEDDASVPITLSRSTIQIRKGRLLAFPIMVDGEGDVEHAFDYFAMEEGLIDEEDEIASEAWKLSFQRDESNAAVPSLQVVPDRLAVADLEQLVQSVLLPCGLPEVEDADVYPLSDKQMYSIQSKVRHFCDEILENLRQAKHKLQAIRTSFNEISGKTLLTQFDVPSSTKLKDCDVGCDEILEQLLMILFRVTKEYHALATLSSEPWADQVMTGLWDAYKHALTKMMQAEFLHVGSVLQLASRSGVVPQMFVCAKHRASTTSMTTDKVEALRLLLNKMETDLFVPLTWDGKVPFLRQLLCYRIFQQMAAGGKVAHRKGEMDAIDNSALRLLKDYAELTNTVYCVNVAEILRTQTTRCDTVLGDVEKLHGLLINESDTMNIELRGDLLASYSKSLSQARAYRDGNTIQEFGGDIDDKSKLLYDYRESLEFLVDNVLSRWRHVRSSSLDEPERTHSRMLPLRLEKWLRGSNDWHFIRNSSAGCEGGCGERRISGILGGLLYRWMTTRCNEWNAELAQNELLEAMEVGVVAGLESDDPDRSEAKVKSKKGKKKREKKKAPGKSDGAPERDGLPADESPKSDDEMVSTEQISKGQVPADERSPASVVNKSWETQAGERSTPSPLPRRENNDIGESSPASGWESESTQPLAEKNVDSGFTSVSPKRAKGKRKGKTKDALPEAMAAEEKGEAESKYSDVKDSIEIPESGPTESIGLETASTVLNDAEGSATAKSSLDRDDTLGASVDTAFPMAGVGVLTAAGLQTAESFLVERLMVVLREKKIDKGQKSAR